MGHFESADPAVWAKSRDGSVNFPDRYRRDFRQIQLNQLTSMTVSMTANNINLPFFRPYFYEKSL